MLRNLCLATFAAYMVSTGGLHAGELSKAKAAPAIAVTPSTGPSAAQAKPVEDLYMLCAFYPKPGTCEAVYQKALKDNSITAEAVRAEYTGYAQYLNGSSPLTDEDRQYLKETGILIPSDLSAVNQTGLHNVINDPALTADARRAAVNNFLSRAVEAELYCGFNSCEADTSRTAAGV
jgi:hypothetical protein